MSALAQILLTRGVRVSGSDRQMSPIAQKLIDKGADVKIGHNAQNIGDAELVVYTAAIAQANVELVAARANGVTCLERADFLGKLMVDYNVPIAVSGTHGKTTTTAMLACIMLAAELDPTVMVGGELAQIDGNLRLGGSEYLVFEACEYVESFLNFNPKVALVLNVEADHLDYYKDIDHIKNSFGKFLDRLPVDGIAVINAADGHAMEVAADFQGRTVTYGASGSDFEVRNAVRSEFDVLHDGEQVAKVRLNVLGDHNVSNALGAFAVAYTLGIPAECIVQGLEMFRGTARRLEYKGEFAGIKVYDDYAHHPTEISATLNASKELGAKRVWCVFQPHTYTRTRALFKDFVTALGGADRVVVTDIYAARENNPGGGDSRDIAMQVNGAVHISDFNEIVDFIRKNARDGDVVLTMGAGDVYKIGEILIA